MASLGDVWKGAAVFGLRLLSMACSLGPDLSIRGGYAVVTDPVFSNCEGGSPNETSRR